MLGISPTRATPPKAAWTVPVEKFHPGIPAGVAEVDMQVCRGR